MLNVINEFYDGRKWVISEISCLKSTQKRRRMQNDFFVRGIFILGCYHQKNNVSSSSRFNDVVRFLSTFACVSLSRMEITKKVKSFFGEATYFYFFSFYVLMSLDIKCVVFNGNIFHIRVLWVYWWHERLLILSIW